MASRTAPRAGSPESSRAMKARKRSRSSLQVLEAVERDTRPSPASSQSDSTSRIESPRTKAPTTSARSGSVASASTSNRRRCEFPALVIEPCLRLSPEERSEGTRPDVGHELRWRCARDRAGRPRARGSGRAPPRARARAPRSAGAAPRHRGGRADASRRSVFTRSPGRLGTSAGATTSQANPRSRRWRWRPNPVAPAS